MIDHYATRRGRFRAEKLTARDVANIRRRRAKHLGTRLPPWHKDSVSSMAEEFGVSMAHISMIAHGWKWRREGKSPPGMPPTIANSNADARK